MNESASSTQHRRSSRRAESPAGRRVDEPRHPQTRSRHQLESRESISQVHVRSPAAQCLYAPSGVNPPPPPPHLFWTVIYLYAFPRSVLSSQRTPQPTNHSVSISRRRLFVFSKKLLVRAAIRYAMPTAKRHTIKIALLGIGWLNDFCKGFIASLFPSV